MQGKIALVTGANRGIGFETCRQLRTMPGLAEVPVIMITALADRSSRLKGIEAGADDFISKPFDQTELRARVRSIYPPGPPMAGRGYCPTARAPMT